jgi:hypothetical protein
MTIQQQAQQQKRMCNICGSDKTYIRKGYDAWYRDPLFASQWLCHRCYCGVNNRYLSVIRDNEFRITRRNDVLKRRGRKGKMSVFLVVVALVSVTLAISAAVPLQVQAQPSTLGAFTLQAEVDADGRDVDDFSMVFHEPGELCPAGCIMSLEDGEFRDNTATGGYVLEGRLVSTVSEGDDTRSSIYNVRTNLDRTEVLSSGGNVVETLDGDMNVGRGSVLFSGDFEYDINGTLSGDTLLLEGEADNLAALMDLLDDMGIEDE